MGVGDWEDCVDGWAVVDPAPSPRKNFSHIRSDDNFFLCMQVGIYLTNIFTKYNENERTLLRPRPPHQKILVGLQKQRFYQTVRSRHAQKGLNDNRKWLGHSTCKTSQTITSGLGTARARLADNREWLGHSTCKKKQHKFV